MPENIPDQPAQAVASPQPESAISNNAELESENVRSGLMILGVIALIIALIFLLVGVIQRPSLDFLQTNQPRTPPPAAEQRDYHVMLAVPEQDSEVNGLVSFSGSSDPGLTELRIRVYDDSDNLLGELGFSPGRADEATNHWTGEVDMRSTPRTDVGRVLVFPSLEGEGGPNSVETAIKFKRLEVSQRLLLYGPIEQQVISGGREFVIYGEMRDFFEGHLNFRFLQDQTVIMEGFVNAEGSNVGRFAKFSKNVTLDTAVPGNGELVLYDINASDGKEMVLLTVPVRYR